MPGWATRKTAEEIRRLVRLGKAREGGQLPSERDLANALQVSRGPCAPRFESFATKAR